MLNRLLFFRQYASRLAFIGIVVTSIAGCGGGSSIASPSTATSPSAPTSIVATAGNASASFSFSAPSNIGGANISSYKVDCTASGVTQNGTNIASPITVSGLRNGISYSCTVSATNSAGTGSASASARVTVTPIAEVVQNSFNGNIVLGVPTFNSIKANVFSATQSGVVSISYGTSSDNYPKQTINSILLAATPLEMRIDGLNSNTRYYPKSVS